MELDLYYIYIRFVSNIFVSLVMSLFYWDAYLNICMFDGDVCIFVGSRPPYVGVQSTGKKGLSRRIGEFPVNIGSIAANQSNVALLVHITSWLLSCFVCNVLSFPIVSWLNLQSFEVIYSIFWQTQTNHTPILAGEKTHVHWIIPRHFLWTDPQLSIRLIT